MSTNKNAIIRYQVFDKCFRNPGRMYFWEDLVSECNEALAELDPENSGIQRRQLFDDIRFMESEQGWSIPLQRYRYGKRVYYRYEDISFSINNQPLNTTEVKQIKSAIQILARFRGMPQFDWVNELIPTVENKLGIIKTENPVIGFDTNIDIKGTEHISTIFNAIVNKRVIRAVYKDFKATESYSVEIHPYYLKQYNNRWFLFGYNEEKNNSFWNMALDRIESIKESDTKYFEQDIDWEDYFFDFIGVTRKGDVVEKVELLFNLETAPYVITKPIHLSQKYKYIDSGLAVVISVIPNFELEQVILSFGEKVKVLSPESLVNLIRDHIHKSLVHYS